MRPESTAHLALRIGVAFAFLYPPIDAVFHPMDWIGYFPQFITALPIESIVILHTFGLIEVAIALWILSGKNIRIPAVVAAIMLIAIVGFNAVQFSILFRDLTIAAMAVALAAWPKPLHD